MTSWARAFLTVVAACAAALVAASPADGQQTGPSLTLDVAPTLGQPLVPNGDGADVAVVWTYDFGNPANAAAVAAAGETVTILFDPAPACERAGIVVAGPAMVVVAQTQPPSQVRTGTTTFRAAASSDAPGQVPVACSFAARATAAGPLSEAVAEPATTSVQVAYLGLVASTAPATNEEGSPGATVTYTVELTNLGNAPTNVAVGVTGLPPGWAAEAPSQVALGSAAHGESHTGTVTVAVHLPESGGWNKEEATFRVTLTPTSVASGDAGRAVELNLLAAVRGWSWSWPAPLFVAAPAAIAAGAAWLGRRRNARKGRGRLPGETGRGHPGRRGAARPVATTLLRPGPTRAKGK